MTTLRSTRVLVGDRLRPADLVTADGTVVAVEPHGTVAGAEDVGDTVIGPGLVDLQVNGGFGFDITLDPPSIWALAARLPEHGVTAFLPTVISGPGGSIGAAIEALCERPSGFVGAEPLGLHLEGPLLSPTRRGAHGEAYLRSQADTSNWEPPAVRLVTLAPEVAGTEVIADLARRGTVVALGHSDADFDTAVAGFEAGATHATHLFSAMPPLHHREPGLAGAALADPGVTVSLICDGVHTHPATVAWALAAVGPDRFVPVTDAVAALGMPPGPYDLGGRSVVSDGDRVALRDGTLAGSLLTMARSVANLVEMAGVDLATSLRCHSANPAAVAGAHDRGRIEVGRRADLVLLGDDGSVQRTLVAGRTVHRR